MVAVAQLVRASGCGPEGRRFETVQPPHLKKPSESVFWFGLFYCFPQFERRCTYYISCHVSCPPRAKCNPGRLLPTEINHGKGHETRARVRQKTWDKTLRRAMWLLVRRAARDVRRKQQPMNTSSTLSEHSQNTTTYLHRGIRLREFG